MEHFIRIAFWIAALTACCLATPLPLIEMSDWDVEYLNRANCEDSKFYSPTNVKNECFITALNCIIAELDGTAQKECTDTEKRISHGLSTLDNVVSRMKKRHNQMVNNSTECDCHKWTERPFDQFVKDVKSLLQEINGNF